MAFQTAYRSGKVWDDVKKLHSIIKKTNFKVNFKNEREVENNFMAAISQHEEALNGEVYSQLHKDKVVKSVYLFGKNHRPDLTINEDGIAVEIKFLSNTLDGLKQAIGQSIFYRVRYRFVINLFVIDEKYKEVYLDAIKEKEKDLEEIFKDLSSDMNIFSYIVPNFSPGSNIKSILEWNNILKDS